MVEVVQPKRREIPFALFERSDDDGGKCLCCRRPDRACLSQEDLSPSVVLADILTKRAASVLGRELMSIDKRRHIDADMPRGARFQVALESNLSTGVVRRRTRVLEAQCDA